MFPNFNWKTYSQINKQPIMKPYLKSLTDFIKIKNKRVKVANYLISLVMLIYLGLIIYPDFLFGYSFKYKNMNIYSTQPLDENIQKILYEVEMKVIASEIYDKKLTHNIYLCKGYTQYTFLAPLSRKSFACRYPIINNIFIANCNVEKNEAYKNDKTDIYTRQLSSLIPHEITHTFIEQKIGFWKSISISTWKTEGYCDFVGFGQNESLIQQQRFLTLNKHDKKPGVAYRKYYIAVNYLLTVRKMDFGSLISSNESLEEVLENVEAEK